ncbi:MAG TPA: hypothetical protein VEJ40_02310 [Pseudolabrys sp.]|nr:hypothetical protein [Pseudolabrys sp.]
MGLNLLQWFEIVGFAVALFLVGWALDSLMEDDEQPRREVQLARDR